MLQDHSLDVVVMALCVEAKIPKWSKPSRRRQNLRRPFRHQKFLELLRQGLACSVGGPLIRLDYVIIALVLTSPHELIVLELVLFLSPQQLHPPQHQEIQWCLPYILQHIFSLVLLP